jgi:hypothetical protein
METETIGDLPRRELVALEKSEDRPSLGLGNGVEYVGCRCSTGHDETSYSDIGKCSTDEPTNPVFAHQVR